MTEKQYYAIYYTKEALIELLKHDEDSDIGECFKTIESIEIQPNGMICIEGEQYKIIDGKVIK